MKKNQSRLLCLFLAVLMLLSLTACGSDASSDPNRIALGDYELLYKSACIMETVDGEDAVVLTLDFINNSKSSASYLWSVSEKAMQDGVELDMAVVVTNTASMELTADSQFKEIDPGKTLEVQTGFVLRDLTSEVKVTFEQIVGKKNGQIIIDPSTLELVKAGAGKSAKPAATGDALLDWWNGPWYGWWTLTGGDGEYEELSNEWWDCCVYIDIGSDYTGQIEIWDEDYTREEGLCIADVSLSELGTGEHGTVYSEGGMFWNCELAHADWIVDPGLVDYENMVWLDGWYEDSYGSFKYDFYIRPWGVLWDDVDEEALPYLYESWYLPLVEAGALMPDVVGGEATEYEAGAAAAAASGDYGQSSAGATGEVSREVMDTAILSLKQDFIWDDVKYSDIRDLLGTDGVPYTSFDSWRDDHHTYEWFAPERVTLLVSFNVKDGEELSSSWSSGGWDGPQYDVTPVQLGSRPEGSGKLVDQSITITDSNKKIEATVSFKFPEGSWCAEKGIRSDFKIINNPTPDNTPFRTPYIKVELYDTLERVNYYQDNFENLTEIAPRTVGGIEMAGRTFKNVGIEWIQYYGELPTGGWITINLAYTNDADGSQCSEILDSMSFK